MKDKYKELLENLSIIINLVKDFEKTKNDYIKPDIRAIQVKISNLSKIIGLQVKDDAQKLNDQIDEYLSDPKKQPYLNLIEKAIILNNDLLEL